MNIKFGDLEYFELLSLQDYLKSWRLSKLDLQYWDKLKMEVDMKIKAINHEHTTRISRLPKGD